MPSSLAVDKPKLGDLWSWIWRRKNGSTEKRGLDDEIDNVFVQRGRLSTRRGQAWYYLIIAPARRIGIITVADGETGAPKWWFILQRSRTKTSDEAMRGSGTLAPACNQAMAYLIVALNGQKEGLGCGLGQNPMASGVREARGHIWRSCSMHQIIVQ